MEEQEDDQEKEEHQEQEDDLSKMVNHKISPTCWKSFL